MKPEEQRNLAIECGITTSTEYGTGWEVVRHWNATEQQLAAYTAAVEAKKDKVVAGYKECIDDSYRDLNELQARIAQLEEAFKIVETQAVMIGVNECSRIAHSAVTELPSTWLSEHDKAVKAKERERCALIADIQPHANSIASRIRELT